MRDPPGRVLRAFFSASQQEPFKVIQNLGDPPHGSWYRFVGVKQKSHSTTSREDLG